MRVLAACSLGGAGHLRPLLPFLDAAHQRGDETLILGPPALGDMAADAGHAFHAGGEPPEAVIAPIRERLPVAPPIEASVLGNRELFGRLATAAMLPETEQVCRRYAPHLVLRDPCEYASAVVTRRMGIPVAQVAISLADAEAGSIAVASPALDEYEAGLADALRAAPYVTRFPGSLDPSPFVRTLRFREPLTPVTPPPADSWGGRSGPRIYMSFGTVLGHMTIAAGVFRTALVAVERLDVRALLTVGRRFDRSVLGPVPENVRVHAWIEQCAALADADLVVCHGGSGTAFGALAAGLPVVVVPVFADQFENGRRIVKAGAGEIVDLPSAQVGARHVIREEDAPLITAAIERVITMPSYRAGAGRIAQEMAAMPTVDEVLDRLLADVA